MKYKHTDNKIIFSEPIKKGKNNIKVIFTRLVDERKTTDLQVFSLIKGKWQLVEKE